MSEKELKEWIKNDQKIKSKITLDADFEKSEDNPSVRKLSVSLGSSKKASESYTSDPSTSDSKTLHFRQSNVHDFAWFADKNWLVQKGELTLESRPDPITLWSFYLPKNAELWRNSIEYLHDSGYWFSKYYGDYPFNHITAVDGLSLIHI